MAGREAGGVEVVAQVGQPNGPGLEDEQAEDAEALGRVADGLGHPLVGAHGDEVGEAAVGADHPEGAVAGPGELGGRCHDAAQHHRQA